MGLLDTFLGNEDQTRALGLLGAYMMAGQTPQGLLATNQFLGEAPDRKMKRDLMGMQVENYKSEIEQRKAAIAKQQRIQDYVGRLLGGGPAPAAPGQLGSGSFGVIPPAAGQPDMPQPRGGLSGASLEQIAGLHAIGGPNLMDAYKFARQGIERKPGSFYEDMQGRSKYVPDPTKGVDFQGGRVTALPGHTDFLSATTMATEGPKALLASAGRVNLRKNQDGTESPVSELDENPTLRSLVGGGPARAPASAPQPQFTQPRPRIAAADQKAADAEAIQMIRAELQNPQLPPDQRAGLEREISRLTASQSQPGFPTPTLATPRGYGKTTAQESREKLVTEASSEVNKSWLKASYEPTVALGQSARDLSDTVQVTRQAMRNLGGTGWSTQAKAAGAAVLSGLGVASKNAELFASNSQLFQKTAMDRLWSTLSEQKGPQTEGDADRAAKTYASLANTPQANEFILDFAEAKAARDQIKARFYQAALPVAQSKGDLAEVDREWAKRAPSIFTMPSMNRWAKGIK